MKIVQVIPQLSFGGAETMCINLSIALKSKGYDVTVISLYNNVFPLEESLKNESIQVIHLNKRSGLDIKTLFKMVKIIKHLKPDIVHSHLYSCKYAHFASILNHIPKRVHTIHNVAQYEASRIDKKINGFLFKNCNVIPVSLSQQVQETVMEVYHIESYRTPIVYNGVPVEKCIPLNDYTVNYSKLIHVGRFAPAKNHLTLINAVVKAKKYVPNLELSLYGTGELVEDAKTLVNNSNANDYIKFCGTSNNIISVLPSFGIFILPSIWEGVPMTLIEAMGTAMPIITTNVGGISNMLTNNIDALVINPTENEITKAIVLLCNNDTLRKKLGQNAKSRSVVFSSKNMASKYIEIYEKRGNISVQNKKV